MEFDITEGVLEHGYVADLSKETIPGYIIPIGERFTVLLRRCKNHMENGFCSLENFMERTGREKAKAMLAELAWHAGKYLQDDDGHLYQFCVEKLQFLKEIFQEKKWGIHLIQDQAIDKLSKYWNSREAATKKIREVLGIEGKKVVSRTNKIQTPKDNHTFIIPAPKRTQTLNSQLAGEIDKEANRYLMKYRPRGWNADLGKKNEEADRKSTEVMVSVWTVLEDPIYRTARGGSPVKKCMKKDGLTNASTKASPTKSDHNEHPVKKGVEPWTFCD